MDGRLSLDALTDDFKARGIKVTTQRKAICRLELYGVPTSADA